MTPTHAARLWLRLTPLVAREWRHHPWRHGVAALAVALGVALAWSVHLINDSALAEFAAAVRSANGEPDLVLRGPREGFDDALFARVAIDEAVEAASPVLEIETYLRDRAGRRVNARVLGIDALRVARLAPDLMPAPAPAADDGAVPAWPLLDPDLAFANAAARGEFNGAEIELQAGPGWQRLRVAGAVPAAGPPLLVMDIAGAQEHFARLGRLTRIDLRLAPGADRAALLARLALPPGVQAIPADEAEQRMSHVSRAYRVNLMVLAAVALVVGGFLVFSVVALSVAQRTPSFALLGVLGMTAGERRALVLGECLVIGTIGSLAGLGLGTALAQAALHALGGDLGAGFFPAIEPRLRVDLGAAFVYFAVGIVAALGGGWWPARAAERLAPAQALKGLGLPGGAAPPAWPGLVLIGAGGALAFLPPWQGLPVAAYAAVGALLFGGVALVPWVVQALLALLAHGGAPRSALVLLALRRAHFQRASAVATTAGVVASLALSVALTVMVGSFRAGVARWLDTVLPADLYARSAAHAGVAEQAWLSAEFVQQTASLPGVLRLQPTRLRAMQWAPGRPGVTLLARPLGDPAATLALIAPPHPLAPGMNTLPGVFVSEAMVSLHGVRPGTTIRLPLGEQPQPVVVRGVYRDYARQFGSVAIDLADYRALTGDLRVNELALWLAPGTSHESVQAAMRRRLADPALLDFASSGELRALSLRIFDRSFAVTHYLQALAITIGLVGVGASLSAQMVARRKEFGLLAHLGLTRAQVLSVVGGEAAAWVAAGTLIGLLLGLALSTVLVYVVNPQSFHWTMQLVIPVHALLALAAAVWLTGTATAVLSARGALSRAAVRSVKEDW